jgi:predicted nucleic acid-binding protein
MAQRLVAFADSNVFLRAILVAGSANEHVVRLAGAGIFLLFTSRSVVLEVEQVILRKLDRNWHGFDAALASWSTISNSVITVVPDVPNWERLIVQESYLPLLRHAADVPILATALHVHPDVILSGNREHFNDAVARKADIPIMSCEEFLIQVSQSVIEALSFSEPSLIDE